MSAIERLGGVRRRLPPGVRSRVLAEVEDPPGIPNGRLLLGPLTLAGLALLARATRLSRA